MNLVRNIGPEDIIITNGCTEALAICLMMLLEKGDTVAIEVPSFYGIFTILENMGIYVLEIPTDPEHGVDYDALKQAVEFKKIKCCILNSNFHNPLGSLMTDAKKEKVVRLPGPVCSSSEGFEEYIRLSCGSLFDDTMENALKIIGDQIRVAMKIK